MNREDFKMLDGNLIYFDNGATTLKPSILTDATIKYYNEYTANAHRGDYDLSLKVDNEYESAREKVAKFINADTNEVAFTSGTTDSLNKIIFGYFGNYLKENDEVIISKSEHASNVLPWYELKDKLNINIKFVELNLDYTVCLENIKKLINENTKVISLAHITNVVGDERDIKAITKLAHEHNILVLVDGAQSVPHIKVDVKDLDVDFLAFSAHKMCGPTGVGVLYGKYDLLCYMNPIIVGGGMNASFEDDFNKQYSSVPHKFEAGTPNIAGVIAFGYVIDYLNSIGMDKIKSYEEELKRYAVEKLKQNKNITIYNENTKSGIIAFNYKNIFAQDLAIYLNKYNICVRAGNHCAKILKNELKVKNTCRISFYFYNTKEEIDKLVKVLENDNIMNELF